MPGLPAITNDSSVTRVFVMRRRFALDFSGLSAAAALAGLVGCTGDGGCHSSRDGDSPQAAVDAYYSACASKPGEIKGPTDADGGSFSPTSTRAEFAVSIGNATRYLIVEQPDSSKPWRVTSDGSGP